MSERETDPFEASDPYDFAGELSGRGPSELPVWSAPVESSDQQVDLFWKRFHQKYWWAPTFLQVFFCVVLHHWINGVARTVMSLFVYALTVYVQFKMLRCWKGTWLKVSHYLVVALGFTAIILNLQLLYMHLCFFLGI